MTDWVNPDLFKSFLQQEEKAAEQQQQAAGPRRVDIVYPTFERGKDDKTAIKYTGRLLPNPNQTNPQYAFKMRYFYHMFKNSDGKWVFVLCPKTWDLDNHCGFCSASMKLYNGTANDKKMAPKYLRKEKYVANYFAIEDPRDVQRIQDGKEKLTGKVWVLEFPAKLNSKILEEQKPGDDSRGMYIYDPGTKGYNMIVLVKSTKPTADGKSFHNYDDSKFALNPGPIADTEEEIKTIMDTRHDIVAYIKGMERTIPDIVSILKDEMIWDLVKDEFKKKHNLEGLDKPEEKEEPNTPVEEDNSPPWEEETTPKAPKESTPKQNDNNDEGNIGLQDLLKQAGIEM